MVCGLSSTCILQALAGMCALSITLEPDADHMVCRATGVHGLGSDRVLGALPICARACARVCLCAHSTFGSKLRALNQWHAGWLDNEPARITGRMETRPAAELGPIILCLDTSGSMKVCVVSGGDWLQIVALKLWPCTTLGFGLVGRH